MQRLPVANDFFVRVAWAALAISLLLGSAYAHRKPDQGTLSSLASAGNASAQSAEAARQGL